MGEELQWKSPKLFFSVLCVVPLEFEEDIENGMRIIDEGYSKPYFTYATTYFRTLLSQLSNELPTWSFLSINT